ncbi:MAG: NAD(P)H-dependent oxidoreductase subunit E [Candidatus Aminicenantales bacterium]
MTVEEILKDSGPAQSELIAILHRLQAEFGHIPPESVRAVARHLRISPSEVYGVLTFYKAFTLEPKGRTIVTVCLGTACHVRGGPAIVEELERRLGVKAGRTSPDGEFSLETVNGLGCFAIWPVVVVNGNYHSNVTLKKIDAILATCRGSGKKP